MTKAVRYISTRPFGSVLVSSLAQLILLGSLATCGWSQPKQDKPEDPFVAQHNRAVRQNPEGASFTLRILGDRGDKAQFRQGEIISVGYSFTSSLRKTYVLDGMQQDRSGRVDLDKFFLDHREGVVDPLGDYMHPGSSMGGIGYEATLGRKPETLIFDLNQWLRFDKPGKFRLYVTARRIQKKGEKTFGNPAEVTSNIVEFEILPRDAEWEEQEFQKIMRLLDSPAEPIDPILGCHRLRYFNTEAAAREMIHRYGAPLDDCDFEYFFGLIGSRHRAFVVREMERRLEAPDQIVSGGYLNLLSHLAYFLQRKDTFPEEWPRDEQRVKAFNAAWQNRLETLKKLEFQYIERLLPALAHKQGKARAIGAHTLLELLLGEWLQGVKTESTALRRGDEIDPEIIKKLRAEIITLFDELPARIQMSLLYSRWKQLADPSMTPVLRRILDARNEKQVNEYSYPIKELRETALRRFYALSPDEGRKLILEEMRRPNSRVDFATLRILKDQTLPELEEILVENLEKARSDDSDRAYLFSSLIERYATASVLPRVRAIYADKGDARSCRYRSSLLAYFLRVNPELGIDLFKQDIAARGSGSQPRCVPGLTEVAKLRWRPELEAIAIERLDDPNPKVVADAASMLGQYGSPATEGPLWRRLEKWVQEWKGRAEELMKEYKHDHPNIWHREAGRALRQALFHSPAWLIDREKLEKLRQSCLDKDELRQFDMSVKELTDNIQITFSPGNDGWGNAQVAHYQCDSFSALKEKIKQFPEGLTFIWSSYGEDRPAAEQVFSELKVFLEEKGMKLEKRKSQ